MIETHPDYAHTCSRRKSFLGMRVRSLIHDWLGHVLKYWFQIEVKGKEHIPANRLCIIAANHMSHLDNPVLIFAAGLTCNNYVLLAAKDYFFERKSIRFFLIKHLFNLIPFDRHAKFAAMHNNIQCCKTCIEEGKNLIIFPEATRSLDGKMHSFKSGCSILACELGLPIVPAYIQGTFYCLPKGKWWPKRGHIRVVFGSPIILPNSNRGKIKAESCRKITKDLEKQIKQLRVAEK